MAVLLGAQALATTDWLATQLGAPDTRIIDARWRPDGTGADVHAASRIPGSTHVDWRGELVDVDATEEAFRITSADRLTAVVARAGIGAASTVVVYDDTLGLYASRVWWTFRTSGLADVRVLDGGFTAWAAEGRAIALGHDPLHGTARPDAFTPRPPDRMRLTTADVRGLLGSPDATILDARSPAEYHGFEGNTRRLGHIPGAINVPVGGMHVPGGQRLREVDALRARLHAANISRGRRMIVYDGSGIAAAKLALVLTVLGHHDVALYDGGWAEWGNRLDLPVDR
jgi:thiosulfate/3-mercaptopyruvate sulfurtransferase